MSKSTQNPKHPSSALRSRSNLLRLFLLFIAVAAIALRLLAPEAANEPGQKVWVEIQGDTMGSTYRLRFVNPYDLNSKQSLVQLNAGLRSFISETVDRISNWKTDSQLSQFNQQSSTDWYAVDAQTVEMVALAAELSAIDKRFDITIAPLSDLWGLGPNATYPSSEPTPAAIDECLQHIGFDKLEFRRAPPALRKMDAQVRINLSALAAGFLADQLAHKLYEQGVVDFYIDVAGEILTGGHNQDGQEWRVGIAEPKVGSQAIQTKLNLTDRGIATSGNYRKFIEIGDQRLGHILDPTTGRPVETDVLSASVIDASCARADALATLLMTMTSSEGIKLANRLGWQVILLVDNEGKVKELRSTP